MTATATKKKATKKTKAKVPRCPAGKLNLAGLQDGDPLSDRVTTVDTFLQTGESDAHWGQFPCIREDGGNSSIFAIRKNGSLARCGGFPLDDGNVRFFSTTPERSSVRSKSSIAVLVKSSKPKLRKFDLILNGDEFDPEDDPPVRLEDKSAGVTASFDIFTELLAPKGKRIPLSRILGWFNDGTIRLLDFSPDETKKLNPAEQRKFSALKEKNNNRMPCFDKLRKAVRPSEAGFTLMMGGSGLQWHRAATILLRHCRKVYIIGQDEGTYFGCELVDRPETIKEAYHSLMPERAHKVIGSLRQGEWFAIPVPVSKVPVKEKCVAILATSLAEAVVLPHENGGHAHILFSGDGRIAADGIFVKGGCLCHDEHNELELPKKQWYTFVKNTAVRSVSRQGVD